ncbi:hypothetical protein GHK92_03595 [Nocardioides sp. dk4132]|uniref:hypothetical protein n=1 Tax=unclassified Nocardioides TaxID=2615069 RepID=UPI001294C10D|nr:MULTISPECIES: hypothetical protein [unclassified Nocardioides]MQW74947.1 hypothetical protein [Nocardioides sp. dk4132]QGA07868.1 hypothetical protein GFH29_11015 [Nocardioides sp. dk884]
MSTSTAAAQDALRQRRYPRSQFLAYQEKIVNASADALQRRSSSPKPGSRRDPNEELTFAAWWRETGQVPASSS